MGFINRVLAGGDESEPDAWTVRHRRPGSSPGWRTVDGYEELPEPIERDEFTWNEPDEELEPGTYRLFELVDGKLRRPPDDQQWSHRVDDPEPDRGAGVDEDRVADRVAARLEERGDFDEHLKRVSVGAYLNGEATLDDIRALATISNMFDGGSRSRLSDTVTDPTDTGEIMGRGLLAVADELQDRGFSLGALAGSGDADGPNPLAQAAEQRREAAQEPADVDEDAEPDQEVDEAGMMPQERVAELSEGFGPRSRTPSAEDIAAARENIAALQDDDEDAADADDPMARNLDEGEARELAEQIAEERATITEDEAAEVWADVSEAAQ